MNTSTVLHADNAKMELPATDFPHVIFQDHVMLNTVSIEVLNIASIAVTDVLYAQQVPQLTPLVQAVTHTSNQL
jgi:hypothetical protein